MPRRSVFATLVFAAAATSVVPKSCPPPAVPSPREWLRHPFLTAGFQRIAHPSGQAPAMWGDVVFLPDESGATSHHAITLGRANGSVKLASDTRFREIAKVDNLFADGDFGLPSVSLAPDFRTSRQVAFLGTVKSTRTRPNGDLLPLSRIDVYQADSAAQPTKLAFVKTVLDGASQLDGLYPSSSRGAGTVVWAPDGTFLAGFPTTDEMLTPDGRGAFNRFTGGENYCSDATGSHLVEGRS